MPSRSSSRGRQPSVSRMRPVSATRLGGSPARRGSSRIFNGALLTRSTRGILATDEIGGARAVLNAAALTYVAATVMAVAQLLRLLLLRGAFGGRDE